MQRLQYLKRWAKTFVVDEFEVSVPPLCASPFKCDEHLDEEGRSICFRCDDQWYKPSPTAGTWSLKTPVDIQTVMPGVDHMLDMVRVKGMIVPSEEWGHWHHGRSDVMAYLDGAEIWRFEGLGHDNRKWEHNDLPVNLPLAGNELDVRLHQSWVSETGTIELHDADLTVECSYYSDIPPEKAKVTIQVTNRETGDTVGNARVRLLHGTTVIADDYTDGGEVVFSNIDEGRYTVRVKASGFNVLEEIVEVTAPETFKAVSLVPKPTKPIPWWVWPAVGGVVLVGAVTMLPRLMGRKRPPVYVVK